MAQFLIGPHRTYVSLNREFWVSACTQLVRTVGNRYPSGYLKIGKNLFAGSAGNSVPWSNYRGHGTLRDIWIWRKLETCNYVSDDSPGARWPTGRQRETILNWMSQDYGKRNGRFTRRLGAMRCNAYYTPPRRFELRRDLAAYLACTRCGNMLMAVQSLELHLLLHAIPL